MAEVRMTLEEYQDLEDRLSTLAMANHNLRDELINDMAEVKRKAEAFDEILNVDYIVAPDDYAHEITKIVDKYREVNN